MAKPGTFYYLSFIATVSALLVVALGAYVRLSDAGLGCPDWPGCYGSIVVPDEVTEITGADSAYPERPLHQGKAWKEMIHRYIAGSLGAMILVLTLLAWKKTRYRAITVFLLALVIFQALLGMWTVTLLLKPVIVTAHLLGGMTILCLLWWLFLCQTEHAVTVETWFMPWVICGLVVVAVQIFLGGWTSANYAALICPEFPACRAGEWLPEVNFIDGFVLWRGLGIDYEGGVLDAASRSAIHISHRLGALLTFIVVGAVACRALFAQHAALRTTGMVLIIILLLQVSLGIANILLVLPLPIAVAHNAGAALLLLCMVSLLYFSSKQSI